MDDNNNISHRVERFFEGKGFYIVLFLCIAAIGVSAWILLFSGVAEKGESAEPVSKTDVSQGLTSGIADAALKNDTADTSAPEKSTQSTYDTAELKPNSEEPDAGTFAEDNSVPTAADITTEEPTDDTTAEAAPPKAYVWPVSGNIAVPYSVDRLIYNKTMADWRTHGAIDIEASIGTKVLAAASGTVEKVYSDDLYGTTVIIDSGDGLKSVYSNLAAVPTVNEGDTVSAGDVIGAVGDTAIAENSEAAHLHFAMTLEDKAVDPGEYLPTR